MLAQPPCHPLQSFTPFPPTAPSCLLFSLPGPRRGKLLIATVQYTLCVGLCITYSVTAGQSLKGVASEECSGVDCQQVGCVLWVGEWVGVVGRQTV